MQDREPPSEYVRKALIDELRLAGVYSASSPVTLIGSVDAAERSSLASDPRWEIALTIASSNGRRRAAAVTYAVPSDVAGDTACQSHAKALVPAVQDLISKFVRSPYFAELASPSPQ